MISTHNISKQYDKRINIKELVTTAMFTALICVLAPMTIPTVPIPFTLALFAIFLTGALLPPRAALMSVLVYLLLGAFGLPVFSGYMGGLHKLTGMTGGYLMAYPLMALAIALSCKYIKKHKIIASAIGMIIALLICYTIGTLWYSYVSGVTFLNGLAVCVVPFILFDLIKMVAAISISTVLKATIPQLRHQ